MIINVKSIEIELFSIEDGQRKRKLQINLYRQECISHLKGAVSHERPQVEVIVFRFCQEWRVLSREVEEPERKGTIWFIQIELLIAEFGKMADALEQRDEQIDRLKDYKDKYEELKQQMEMGGRVHL